MMLVRGFPACAPRLGEGLRNGTLHVLVDGEVTSFPIEDGHRVTGLTYDDGEKLPDDAELWFESASEKSH